MDQVSLHLPTLQTKRIKLRPIIEDKDMPLLFQWRNDARTMHLWIGRNFPVSWEQFKDELFADFNRDRHIQLMIEKGKQTIGTIYSYSPNFSDGTVFVTTYLSADYTKRGYGVEALLLFADYLMTYYPFRKIYLESYEYNRLSKQTLEKGHMEEEGCFKAHRYFDGRYWNLYRFALYQERLDEVRAYLAKLDERR